jgi:hypothetical protein
MDGRIRRQRSGKYERACILVLDFLGLFVADGRGHHMADVLKEVRT